MKKSFSHRAKVHHERMELAYDFCISAGLSYLLMGFYDTHAKSFVESWLGRAGESAECDLLRKTETVLAVKMRLAESNEIAKRRLEIGATHRSAEWITSGSLMIGLGAPTGHLVPVIAFECDDEEITAERKSLFRIGLAHVSHQLTEEIDHNRAEPTDMMETAMQVLSISFLVVDGEGRVRFESGCTGDAAPAYPGWSITDGYLTAGEGNKGSGITKAIQNATAATPKSSVIPVTLGGGERRLVVVIPLSNAEPKLAMILFERKDSDRLALREWFFDAYSLTPSERLIAHDILSGLSANEMADSRGFAVATVRSYIKQVLSKTNTHRQSELVSLYYATILPISPPSMPREPIATAS
jgi:DNA-binding CsgD family transcriptional regulator